MNDIPKKTSNKTKGIVILGGIIIFIISVAVLYNNMLTDIHNFEHPNDQAVCDKIESYTDITPEQQAELKAFAKKELDITCP